MNQMDEILENDFSPGVNVWDGFLKTLFFRSLDHKNFLWHGVDGVGHNRSPLALFLRTNQRKKFQLESVRAHITNPSATKIF